MDRSGSELLLGRDLRFRTEKYLPESSEAQDQIDDDDETLEIELEIKIEEIAVIVVNMIWSKMKN